MVSRDTNLLLQVACKSKSKILMQTCLDANDGSANVLIDQMQMTAVETLKPATSKHPEGWMLACVKQHFEWHYDLHTNEMEDLAGWLQQSVTPTFCVTPGLTLALAPSGSTWSEYDKLPIYPHD